MTLPKIENLPQQFLELTRFTPTMDKKPFLSKWQKPTQQWTLNQVLEMGLMPGLVLGDYEEVQYDPSDEGGLGRKVNTGHWWCVDVDDCRDKDTGEVCPVALGLVRAFGGNPEISMSGTGLHIFGRGDAPEGFREGKQHALRDSTATVEIYTRNHQVVLTGNALDSGRVELATDSKAGAVALRHAIAEPMKAKRGKKTADQLPLVVEALQHLSQERCDDRASWVEVGMAIHHESGGSAEGYATWDEWSQLSEKYDAQDTERVWESFVSRELENGEALGVGSLLRWAREDTDWTRAPDKLSNTFADDIDNSQRFIEQHIDKARYVTEWEEWYVYDEAEGRWQSRRDGKKSVTELGKYTARTILNDANELFRRAENETERTIAWNAMCEAKKSQSSGKIRSMIELASADPRVRISFKEFNTDPMLLNCTNYVVGLRTGELLPHDPNMLITKTTGVKYPDAPYDPKYAPNWEKACRGSMQNNAEHVKYLRRLLGGACSGDLTDEAVIICYGDGANGKNAVIESGVIAALGEYGAVMPENFLTETHNERHLTELANLYGVRVAFTDETKEGAYINEARIKRLTSENITARGMHENLWTFKNTATHILSTNYKPHVRTGGDGFWRRIHVLPFLVRFVKSWERDEYPDRDKYPDEDPKLKRNLRAERGWILRWLVEAGVEAYEQDITIPELFSTTKKEYEDNSHSVKQWLADRCIIGAELTTIKSDAYASYLRYMKIIGDKDTLSQNLFGRCLTKMGFNPNPDAKNKDDQRIHEGFELREECNPYR